MGDLAFTDCYYPVEAPFKTSSIGPDKINAVNPELSPIILEIMKLDTLCFSDDQLNDIIGDGLIQFNQFAKDLKVEEAF